MYEQQNAASDVDHLLGDSAVTESLHRTVAAELKEWPICGII